MLPSPQTGHRAIAQGRAQVWSEARGPRVKCGGSAFGHCEGTWLLRPRPTAEGKGLGWAAGSSLQDTVGGKQRQGWAGADRVSARPLRVTSPGAGRPAGWRPLHSFQTEREERPK